MTEILIIVCTILCAICLILLVALLLKKKKEEDGSGAERLRRLEEKTDAVGKLADYNARTLERMDHATEARLVNIQNRLTDDIKYVVDVNAQNLERIRRTVDEKLTTSIDGKLSDSFARITERLEKMYESVGEMKGLSSSVADIRRVFSNVKLRGTWGEAQLDALLEQMLAPEQYRRSVKLNPLDNSLVDFAIVLPARDGEMYLPVDSKFPVEEFERLVSASERGDREGEERARKNLERAVRTQAESIARKYILPPVTSPRCRRGSARRRSKSVRASCGSCSTPSARTLPNSPNSLKRRAKSCRRHRTPSKAPKNARAPSAESSIPSAPWAARSRPTKSNRTMSAAPGRPCFFHGKTLAFCACANYNRSMNLTRLTAMPENIDLPPSHEAFGEARSVQSGSVRSCKNLLLIESGGRFKRFCTGTEIVRIEQGSGHLKWKRGELPFAEGDIFAAEDVGEYDFYGGGVFLIVKENKETA